jgi:hypothetical protein
MLLDMDWDRRDRNGSPLFSCLRYVLGGELSEPGSELIKAYDVVVWLW